MVDKEKNVSWKISRRDDSVRQPPSNRGDTLSLSFYLYLSVSLRPTQTPIYAVQQTRDILQLLSAIKNFYTLQYKKIQLLKF